MAVRIAAAAATSGMYAMTVTTRRAAVTPVPSSGR